MRHDGGLDQDAGSFSCFDSDDKLLGFLSAFTDPTHLTEQTVTAYLSQRCRVTSHESVFSLISVDTALKLVGELGSVLVSAGVSPASAASCRSGQGASVVLGRQSLPHLGWLQLGQLGWLCLQQANSGTLSWWSQKSQKGK